MKILNEKALSEVAERYDIRLLLLFGSRATGETHPESDYDFAFESGVPLDYGRQTMFLETLMKLIGSERVDGVDICEASPFLLREILRNHHVLFSKDFAYEDFYSRTFRTCLDSRYLYRMEEEKYQSFLDLYRKKYA